MCNENTNEVETLEEYEVAELIPPFEESLFSPVWDTSIDYIELGIDTLFKDGVLKDIPIVGSIIGAGKLVYNIADRNPQYVYVLTEIGKIYCQYAFLEI